MLIHDLTPQECRELIRRLAVGRLACARDNQPYVVPISYSFDAARDCLYCFFSRRPKNSLDARQPEGLRAV